MTKREGKAELVDIKGLLERDEDFVRSAVETLVQAALEAEMTEAIGAAKGERSETRISYRTGYYTRWLITRVGTLELRVPQDRMGRFSTELFERYQRSEKALVGTLAEMYVAGGVDAEEPAPAKAGVKAVTEALCGHSFSASSISGIARVTELLEMVALPDLSAAIQPLLRVREGMRTERKAFDRTLAGLSRRDDITRRLMTIPGVGPVTSLAFKATIDESGRFATSKALGAHLGLTPRVYQSGEIDRSGHISKCGDRMMRHLLYEAASVLMTRTRKWSRLRAWGVSVAKRRGMKRATVAVARKLAVIMHRIWVTGGEFEFGSSAAAANAA